MLWGRVMSQSACIERTTESAGFRRPSREDGERVQRAGVKTVSVGLMPPPPMQWSVPNSLVRPLIHAPRGVLARRSLDRSAAPACPPFPRMEGWHTRRGHVCPRGGRTQPLTNNGGATDTAKRTRTYDVRVFRSVSTW